MAQDTKIEWADHTFNPWEGCQKVGPGCDHCYAEARNARFGGGQAVNWGPGAPRRRTSEANWKLPLKWNAQAAREGRRFRVFCSSLADVFDNAVPVQWRIGLMRLIMETRHLDWLLLTKRIGNAAEMLETAMRGHTAQREGWRDNVPAHVWIGATVVNQEEADRDIPKLLAVPAAKRFLSMEPLLAAVDIRFSFSDSRALCCPTCGFRTNRLHHGPCPNEGSVLRSDVGVDWVIVGGESGNGARPVHPQWARDIRDQCGRAGVPFLFKQWGEWLPAKDGRSITGKVIVLEGAAPFAKNPEWHVFPDGQQVARIGKKAAGRRLDGVEHNGFPS